VRAKLILIANLVLGGGLLWFVLHSYGGKALEILRADPSLPMLALFVAVVAATVVFFSWRWGYVMAGLCPPVIGLLTLALYRSAAHTLAVVVPSGKLGGDPLRAWLAAHSGVAPGDAIASVAVDRTLEIGSAAPFSLLFATLLLQHGIPQLEQALITVVVATLGVAIGVGVAVHRLKRGAGLVTALARATRMDRLHFVDDQMDVLEASESAAAQLVDQPQRMFGAFMAGIGANLLVIAEFALLLTAFGLPCTPIAVVAAIFATGAAHMFPIPAGIGVLEGSQMWLFEMLGYPADVGLAVGLAVRFRELLWMLPGLLYLLGRSLNSSLGRLRAV